MSLHLCESELENFLSLVNPVSAVSLRRQLGERPRVYGELYDFLGDKMFTRVPYPRFVCDHKGLYYTRVFCKMHGLDHKHVETIFRENLAFCDCRVVMNMDSLPACSSPIPSLKSSMVYDRQQATIDELSAKLRERSFDEKNLRERLRRELLDKVKSEIGENSEEIVEIDFEPDTGQLVEKSKVDKYRPRGYIEEIKNSDLFDKQAYTDTSLTVRERNQVIRDSWRNFV